MCFFLLYFGHLIVIIEAKLHPRSEACWGCLRLWGKACPFQDILGFPRQRQSLIVGGVAFVVIQCRLQHRSEVQQGRLVRPKNKGKNMKMLTLA